VFVFIVVYVLMIDELWPVSRAFRGFVVIDESVVVLLAEFTTGRQQVKHGEAGLLCTTRGVDEPCSVVFEDAFAFVCTVPLR
jgi:hypothetical protein